MSTRINCPVIFSHTETVPADWIVALVNADVTHLSDAEEAAVDAWERELVGRAGGVALTYTFGEIDAEACFDRGPMVDVTAVRFGGPEEVLTDDMVRALESEASANGDGVLAAHCALALVGQKVGIERFKLARDTVCDAINAAREGLHMARVVSLLTKDRF